MTKRMLAKSAKSMVVFAFIAFILVQTVGMKVNTDNIDTLAQNMDTLPINQATSELSTLPFFEDTEGVSEWLTDYLYNTQTALTSKAYFAETDQAGTTVTDNRTYIEDLAVYVDSLANLVETNPAEKSAIISRQEDYALWDTNSTTAIDGPNAGYFSYTEDDWETTSGVQEFEGNAQIILSFIDDLITEVPSGATYNIPTIITDQYSVIDGNFWDTTAKMYSHSSLDSMKYIEDQFIGAIIGFQTHRSNNQYLSSGVRSNALSKAEAIMGELFQDVSVPIRKGDGNAFYNSYEEDGIIKVDDDFYLATNAYGIWALVEFYIESGIVAEDTTYDWILQGAEDLYSFIDSILWNSSYSLYMHKQETSSGSLHGKDESVYLNENAVMMVALKRLFEVTGDQMYFDRLMEMYNSIETIFRDPIYGNYYTSVESNVFNTNKNLNTHAYYYRALAELEELSDYMDMTLTLNETNLVKGEVIDLEIEGNYFADIVISHTNPTPDTLIEHSVSIAGSDFYFNIRDPDGIVINETRITATVDGTFIINFPISDDLDPGTYEISMYANCTGLATVFETAHFTIKSGLTLESYFFFDGSHSIPIGGTKTANITLSSERTTDFNFTATAKGAEFVEYTVNGSIESEEEANVTLEIGLLNDIVLGDYDLTIEIHNGTTVYERFTISVSAYSPLGIIGIEQDRYAFIDQDYRMLLEVRNLVNHNQNCTIIITGDQIAYLSMKLDLSGSENMAVPITLDIDDGLSFGVYFFTFDIKRNLDEEILYTEVLQFSLKPEIEIISLEYPEILAHGEVPTAMCIIKNNIEEVYQITIKVDGEKIDGITQILPGESKVYIPLGNAIKNPYKFSSIIKEIEILDKNQQFIHQQTIDIDLSLSFSSLFFGYILPILIPVLGLVIVHHFALENKKRLSI